MKIAFLGFGNMARAMAQGWKAVGLQDLMATGRDQAKLAANCRTLGVTPVDNGRAAREADLVILGVKPYQVADLAQEIRPQLRPETLIGSVAAGIDLESLARDFQSQRLVRILPNTPVAVGEGVCLYAFGSAVSPAERQTVKDLLEKLGSAEEAPEAVFAGGGSMTGCSPAFLYLLIEAMTDAAVHEGMPRDLAQRLAAQTVKGSAEMVLKTGLHPGQLKDQVTSPGGTTIAGIRSLEANGFRSAMMEAIIAAAHRK